ncbi:MAG TPA: DUF3455 domain-containing protein [Steroidobacteraceae bacterium]|nr:DUF3455 domain-containing protein [Steroidobacteraceae bacterium]
MAAAAAAAGADEELPLEIAAPAGEHLVLRTHAEGVQIYACAVTGGVAQWTLKAPEAELRDGKGPVIVHHSAGPTWKHQDGSEITGKAVAHADAPDRRSIPWLLLAVVGHAGTGTLAHVTHVQRIHTHGGEAPPAAQCDAAKQGSETRVPYRADYLFYAPRG